MASYRYNEVRLYSQLVFELEVLCRSLCSKSCVILIKLLNEEGNEDTNTRFRNQLVILEHNKILLRLSSSTILGNICDLHKKYIYTIIKISHDRIFGPIPLVS